MCEEEECTSADRRRRSHRVIKHILSFYIASVYIASGHHPHCQYTYSLD